MTARLTLISHAATSASRAAAFPLDEPIDAAGEAQARTLGIDLRRPDLAWTSPALCARQTAAALGLDPVVEPALRDMESGSWAGRRLADIAAEEPEALAAWIAEPAAAPPGGESLAALLARVAPWLEARLGQSGHLVAVSHPAVIRAAIILAIGAPANAFWRIDVGPLCRVELRSNGKRWSLRALVA